jgi:hypothetical protein
MKRGALNAKVLVSLFSEEKKVVSGEHDTSGGKN